MSYVKTPFFANLILVACLVCSAAADANATDYPEYWNYSSDYYDYVFRFDSGSESPTASMVLDFGQNNPAGQRSGTVTVEITGNPGSSANLSVTQNSLHHGPSTQTRNVIVANSVESTQFVVSPSPEWTVGQTISVAVILDVNFELTSETRFYYAGQNGYPGQWSGWVTDSTSHMASFQVSQRDGVVHSKALK